MIQQQVRGTLARLEFRHTKINKKKKMQHEFTSCMEKNSKK